MKIMHRFISMPPFSLFTIQALCFKPPRLTPCLNNSGTAGIPFGGAHFFYPIRGKAAALLVPPGGKGPDKRER